MAHDAKPFEDRRADALTGRRRAGRGIDVPGAPRDSRDENERGEERGRVDGEAHDARAEHPEQQPGDAGPHHAADDLGGLGERVGCRKAFSRDDMRQHRGPRRPEERPDRGLDEPEDKEEGHEGRRLDQAECEDHHRPQQIGGQHGSAPIPSIDVDARHEADREGGHGLGDGHQRKHRGRAGQVVDDEEDEQQRDAVADVADDLSAEQVAVVADAEDVAHAHRRGVGHRSSRPLVRG